MARSPFPKPAPGSFLAIEFEPGWFAFFRILRGGVVAPPAALLPVKSRSVPRDPTALLRFTPRWYGTWFASPPPPRVVRIGTVPFPSEDEGWPPPLLKEKHFPAYFKFDTVAVIERGQPPRRPTLIDRLRYPAHQEWSFGRFPEFCRQRSRQLREVTFADGYVPQPNPAVSGAGDGVISDNRFWELIGPRPKRFTVAGVSLRLRKCTAAEVVGFERKLQEKMSESYTWPLWAAAYIINGGASDDGFEYFRGWLLMQGREIYENALRDPESLVEHAQAEVEGEDLLWLSRRVFAERFEEPMPDLDVERTEEPVGEPWEEEELPRRYPRLWKRFVTDATPSE